MKETRMTNDENNLARRSQSVASLVSSKKVSFTEAYKRFREEYDLEELGFTKEFFDDLRDKPEGRNVTWK